MKKKTEDEKFFSTLGRAGHFLFGLALSPLGLASPYKAVTSCHGHAYVMGVTSHDPRAVSATFIPALLRPPPPACKIDAP